MSNHVIPSERCDLVLMTVESLEAAIAGDQPRLARLAGTDASKPWNPPELVARALPRLLDRLRTEPAAQPWLTWLVVLRATGEVVGTVGLKGPPDETGMVEVGYATQPGHEGQGYATEGARALIAWAFAQSGVTRVQATIPTWHAASIRIAEKLNMRQVGTRQLEQVGEILVCEVEREAWEPRDAGTRTPSADA